MAYPSLGHILIVTAGCGWVQREGGAVEEIRPGDVIWFAPGEKHWHGATPSTGMTHIAILEQLDGKNADWLEQVYKPDILNKWDNVYKKPGYDPSDLEYEEGQECLNHQMEPRS